MSAAKGHILLVEDDPVMGGSLVQRLKLEGFAVEWTRTAFDGLGALKARRPDAIVSDIRLPDRSGEDLYMDALRFLGRTPIVFVTAFGDLQQAIRLVQAGADDYVQKPFSTDKLVARLHHLIARARKPVSAGIERDPFVLSPTMASLAGTLQRVADADMPVLISGETGVGKEIAARYLYENSKRRGAPFVAFNCGSIAAEFAESALFGHERGAFPGAVEGHVGFLEEAADGVLLLDEIGDLAPQVQATLLRALQERNFRRVGGSAALDLKARVIATTNADLKERVAGGRFRDDLYFRLAVVEITIPPLRKRIGEIKALAEYFLSDACARFDRPPLTMPAEAQQALLRHDWPGNVRELQNRIERAVAMTEGDVITEFDLFPEQALFEERPTADKPLVEARAVAERKEIEIALAQCDGRIGDAAKVLGISRTTLWKRMKALGLSSAEAAERSEPDAE